MNCALQLNWYLLQNHKLTWRGKSLNYDQKIMKIASEFAWQCLFNKLIIRALKEDQKTEIERRMREECSHKIKKYDDAYKKMKNDFEEALRVADKETSKLALERNEYYTKYVNLKKNFSKFKERKHVEMYEFVAENCRDMVQKFATQKGFIFF